MCGRIRRSPCGAPPQDWPACLPRYKSTIGNAYHLELSSRKGHERRCRTKRSSSPFSPLPFVGSCLAALLQAECPQCRGVAGRRDCAHQSGAPRRASYPRIVNGGVIRSHGGLGAGSRPRVQLEDGWLRLDVRHAGHRHRLPGGAVRALLHVPGRSGAAVLFLPARVHGRHARHRAVGQPDPARLLLGTDEPLLLPPDRLLASERAGSRRRAHGPDHHVRRRALPLRRRADDRPYRRQLRSRPGAGVRRPHPLASPLRSGLAPRAARRLHQERPISVPFLAAARDGGSNARLRLSAFGHHGEGRRFSADPAVARDGRDERMAVAGGIGRPDHVHPRRLPRDVPAGPQGAAGLLDHQPSRTDHAC